MGGAPLALFARTPAGTNLMSLAELSTTEPVVARPRANRTQRAALGTSCNVAVIGAGPYGLAVAAHLKATGVEARVFGEPLGFWRHNMPKGMKLRSPWRATHIADPHGAFTLDRYAQTRVLPRTENLPLEDFVAYGEWFQRSAVPNLDRRRVRLVTPEARGFRLVLDDDETVTARRVVIAMGLAHQDYRPPEFAGLPASLASHSCEHADLAAFRGRRVAVIGRGQSAVESAVLLSEGGAEVEIISRGEIRWIGSETPDSPERGWRWRVRELLTPTGSVGPFPHNWLVDMPGVTRLLPLELRDKLSVRSLRPAASAWLRLRANDIRPVPGRVVTRAQANGSRLLLELDDGTHSLVDHALLATGYRVDIGRLGVLAPDLVGRVAQNDGYPVLDAGFQSSVPGLHFVGSSALKSIGPLMRFIWGAGYAARRVAGAASR